MKKRALSLFLAVVMTLSLAAPAIAAEPFLAEESAAQEDTAPAPAAPEDPVPAEDVPAPEPAPPVGEAAPAPEQDEPMPASEEADRPMPIAWDSVKVTSYTGNVAGDSASCSNLADAITKAKEYAKTAGDVSIEVRDDVGGITFEWDGGTGRNVSLYIYAAKGDAAITSSIAVNVTGSGSAGAVKFGAMPPGANTEMGTLTVENMTVDGSKETLGTVELNDGGIYKSVEAKSGTIEYNGGKVAKFEVTGPARLQGNPMDTEVTFSNSSEEATIYGAVTNAKVDGGTVTVSNDHNVSKVTLINGKVYVYSTVTTIDASGGEVAVSGGTVSILNIECADSGTVAVTSGANSGTVKQLNVTSGTAKVNLHYSGCTIDNLDVRGGTAEISYGTVKTATAESGTITVINSGSLEKLTVNGTVSVSGRTGNLTVESGTATINGDITTELTVKSGGTAVVDSGTVAKATAVGGTVMVGNGNLAALTVDSGEKTVTVNRYMTSEEGRPPQYHSDGKITTLYLKAGAVDISGNNEMVKNIEAKDGTITLSGLETQTTLTVNGSGTVTVAGNGRVLNLAVNSGTAVITDGSRVTNSATAKGGAVTVKSGTLEKLTVTGDVKAGGTGEGTIGTLEVTSGTAEIIGKVGAVTVSGTGSATVSEGGNVAGTLDAGGTGTVSVEGGTVGTLTATGATVTVSGGTINTLDVQAGSVTLSGGTYTTIEVTTETGTVAGLLGGGCCYAKDRYEYETGADEKSITGPVTVMKKWTGTGPQENSPLTFNVNERLVKKGDEGIWYYRYALSEGDVPSTTGGDWSQDGSQYIPTTDNLDVGDHYVWWKVEPSEDGETAGKIDRVKVTIGKGDISEERVVTAPTAKDLTYNGSAQELVDAGSVDSFFGTMKYALDTVPADENGWTDNVDKITGTDAESYTVWYKVAGDKNHTDTAAKSVEAAIGPKEVTLIWSDVSDLVYTGEPANVTATAETGVEGETVNVTVELDGDNNVGTHTAKATGLTNGTGNASNYKLPDDVEYTYTISPAPLGVTAPTAVEGLTWSGGEPLALVDAGRTEHGEMRYSLDGETYSAAIPTGGEGENKETTYTVYWQATGGDNYTDENGQVTVTVKKAAAKSGDTYYATLKDAIGAGGEITLLADTEEALTVDKPVTLKSDDPYRVTGSVTVAGGALTVNAKVTVEDLTAVNGTVSVMSGAVTVGGKSYAHGGGDALTLTVDDGKVTLEAGAVVLPEGGTVTTGGMTVSGTGRTVTKTAQGFTVELGSGESVTIDGKNYTNNGTGNAVGTASGGAVTWAPAEDVSVDIVPPVTGLKLAKDDVYTVETTDGKTFTLKGAPAGGTVDIDKDGSVTATAGHVSVKGDVTVQAGEGATAIHVGDMTVAVEDKDGNPITGAQVTVTAVTENSAEAKDPVTTKDGRAELKDLPYGAYNVTIKYTLNGTEYTTTGSLMVSAVTGEQTFTFEAVLVTATVEGGRPPAVENLTDAISDRDKQSAVSGSGGATSIDITLKSEPAGEDKKGEKDAIQEKIKQELGGTDSGEPVENTVTDFVDVTITKETTTTDAAGNETGTRQEPVTQTAKLLTLRFPISAAMRAMLEKFAEEMEQHVFVFRYHGSAAERMRRVSAAVGATASYECYYLEGEFLVIRARNFSVYAFGVSNEPVQEYKPSTGGGGTTWPTADKTALEKAIAAAEALKEADYTPESWAALETALAAAKDAADFTWAAQEDVDAAAAALRDAIDALVKAVPAVDKSALEMTIDAAEELTEEGWTAESWAALAAALEAARAVYADPDATQEEVDDASLALSIALLELEVAEEPEVDKSDLEAAIADAEGLDPEDYTEESWAAVADALAAAKDVAADANATQADVDAARKALDAAVGALVPAEAPDEVDKSALEQLIAAAEATAGTVNEADCTPESWAFMVSALEAAKAIYADPDATQEGVDAAILVLFGAVMSLEPAESEPPAPPSSGTGWMENESGIYFYKDGELKKNFWVGKADGASRWDGNWYYVGADGKLLTGMQYLTDLHGGMGWYFLQPTNANGEIGKMLTGWQWVGGEYGTGWFSTKTGSAGKCTYTTELGDWTGSAWVK